MSANTQQVFPNSPTIGIGTLTSATAVTSRANIAGTTGLTQLTPTATNAKRIDAIVVKGKGTTVASMIGIWLYNGTTSFLIDEIPLAGVTAGNTAASERVIKLYGYPNEQLVQPGGSYQLFISQTVQTDCTVFALGGDY